jgi:hypothetical protein
LEEQVQSDKPALKSHLRPALHGEFDIIEGASKVGDGRVGAAIRPSSKRAKIENATRVAHARSERGHYSL